MQRRTFLGVAGAGLASMLAGCGSSIGIGDGEQSSNTVELSPTLREGELTEQLVYEMGVNEVGTVSLVQAQRQPAPTDPVPFMIKFDPVSQYESGRNQIPTQLDRFNIELRAPPKSVARPAEVLFQSPVDPQYNGLTLTTNPDGDYWTRISVDEVSKERVLPLALETLLDPLDIQMGVIGIRGTVWLEDAKQNRVFELPIEHNFDIRTQQA